MSVSANQFMEGDIVEYNIGLLKGKGKVKGIAQSAIAVIGRTYILEDLSRNMPSEIYPYSHFCCFEVNLKKSFA